MVYLDIGKPNNLLSEKNVAMTSSLSDDDLPPNDAKLFTTQENLSLNVNFNFKMRKKK